MYEQIKKLTLINVYKNVNNTNKNDSTSRFFFKWLLEAQYFFVWPNGDLYITCTYVSFGEVYLTQ